MPVTSALLHHTPSRKGGAIAIRSLPRRSPGPERISGKARPVCPQLRKCQVRPGSYAWCHLPTSGDPLLTTAVEHSQSSSLGDVSCPKAGGCLASEEAGSWLFLWICVSRGVSTLDRMHRAMAPRVPREDEERNTCPCCDGRMIIVETFEPGCQPQLWPFPSIGLDSS
jgi:hypothetical protein